MKKIGITGGIGSGKTTVCKIFEALGIPVYYADDRAKWLMEHDEVLRKKIIAIFGDSAYDQNLHLNRTYLAEVAFSNPEKLQELNAAVHPAVATDAERWHHKQQGVLYTIKEAALIYESGSFKQLDKVIVVTAPEALRIERVVARDHTSAQAVKDRIARQMPETEKVKLADFVIVNDGKRALVPQVMAIHGELCK